MRRPALYSSSRSGKPAQQAAADATLEPAAPRRSLPGPGLSAASPALLWAAILLLAVLLAFSLSLGVHPCSAS